MFSTPLMYWLVIISTVIKIITAGVYNIRLGCYKLHIIRPIEWVPMGWIFAWETHEWRNAFFSLHLQCFLLIGRYPYFNKNSHRKRSNQDFFFKNRPDIPYHIRSPKWKWKVGHTELISRGNISFISIT